MILSDQADAFRCSIVQFWCSCTCLSTFGQGSAWAPWLVCGYETHVHNKLQCIVCSNTFLSEPTLQKSHQRLFLSRKGQSPICQSHSSECCHLAARTWGIQSWSSALDWGSSWLSYLLTQRPGEPRYICVNIHRTLKLQCEQTCHQYNYYYCIQLLYTAKYFLRDRTDKIQ